MTRCTPPERKNVGHSVKEAIKVASFKWPPGNRRYAREQADSDRHLESIIEGAGLTADDFR
jgi:hypothetical protein